jgi:hypothetical protein
MNTSLLITRIRKEEIMSTTITKTGKRDQVADDIEHGDHHSGAEDQTQIDNARAYIAAEIRRAATPQHDVHVTVTGHHADNGVDPARQYRRITIEIVASPPQNAAGPQRGMTGLTAETAHTDTPAVSTLPSQEDQQGTEDQQQEGD